MVHILSVRLVRTVSEFQFGKLHILSNITSEIRLIGTEAILLTCGFIRNNIGKYVKLYVY
jgi:hypothetical protein